MLVFQPLQSVRGDVVLDRGAVQVTPSDGGTRRDDRTPKEQAHHHQRREGGYEQHPDHLQHETFEPIHCAVDEAIGDLLCIADEGLVLFRDRLAKIVDRRLSLEGQVFEDRKPFALREVDRAGEVRRDGIDCLPPFRRDDVRRLALLVRAAPSTAGTSREMSAAARSADATARAARGIASFAERSSSTPTVCLSTSQRAWRTTCPLYTSSLRLMSSSELATSAAACPTVIAFGSSFVMSILRIGCLAAIVPVMGWPAAHVSTKPRSFDTSPDVVAVAATPARWSSDARHAAAACALAGPSLALAWSALEIIAHLVDQHPGIDQRDIRIGLEERVSHRGHGVDLPLERCQSNRRAGRRGDDLVCGRFHPARHRPDQRPDPEPQLLPIHLDIVWVVKNPDLTCTRTCGPATGCDDHQGDNDQHSTQFSTACIRSWRSPDEVCRRPAGPGEGR